MKNFDSDTNVLAHFRSKVLDAIEEDFEHLCSIIVQGNDKYNEMSLGFDAQVYHGSMDFRFCNNTDYPIRIQAVISGGYLTVSIIGTDSRTHKLELTYKVDQILEPSTVINTMNPNNIGGYVTGDVLDEGQTGYVITTYALKYDEEGILMEEILIAESYYAKRDKVIVDIADPDIQEPTIPDETEPSEPTTPAPTEPTVPDVTDPSVPTPTEPAPTEPTPTEPAPTEPTVPEETTPVPTDPVPTEPVVNETVPEDPTPGNEE